MNSIILSYIAEHICACNTGTDMYVFTYGHILILEPYADISFIIRCWIIYVSQSCIQSPCIYFVDLIKLINGIPSLAYVDFSGNILIEDNLLESLLQKLKQDSPQLEIVIGGKRVASIFPVAIIYDDGSVWFS